MTQEHTGWLDELRSAYLYRVIAECERGTPRETLFRSLATEAEVQAKIWAEKAGMPLPVYRPDLRTRIVAGLARAHGPRAMRAVLAAMKVRGLSIYTHAAPGHPAPTSIDGMESRHRGMGVGGNLRAAVFGINDGLVSNMSLILGVAGADVGASAILLSGIAGLLAGAFSMAAGEYVSVRSQREMYEHQIGLERNELAEYPAEEAEELALIYAARGMPKDQAIELARRTIADPEKALDTLSREELGLNPDDLGSPWGAASSSFVSFAIGAGVPLVPFAFASGDKALLGAVAFTGVALFAIGAVISLFTGRSAHRDGLRMLGIGAAAGGITYLVGKLMGVVIN
ncbi:MAG: VIT1/CCC1 transporter family protein [Betaproteobacteria bacterium]|nr:VIT1/CCC1 transporter family protein [Betaproteobacteria bacterium]